MATRTHPCKPSYPPAEAAATAGASSPAVLPAGVYLVRVGKYALRRAVYQAARDMVSQATGLALFLNPTRSAATLTGAQPGAPVQVYDAVGRLVLRTTASAAGAAALALPADLATGVYLVRTGSSTLRLTVE